MKKYHIYINGEQQGPFDLQELKEKKIKKDTPIWFEGMSEWKTADQISELQVLFYAESPPKYNSTIPPKETTKSKPKVDNYTRAGKILQGIGILGAIVIVVFFVFKFIDKNSGATSSRSYEQKIMSVEEIERSQPTKFLKADGTYKETFWGDKIKIKCTISNKATVASYKDPVIKIIYYSKTKTVLGSESQTVYEVFPPHSQKTMDLKIDNYKDVNSIGWEVVSAVGL